jgi:hypothetical protein
MDGGAGDADAVSSTQAIDRIGKTHRHRFSPAINLMMMS